MATSENVKVSNHPVLLHKLTLLRNVTIEPREFRQLLREVTFYLGYEATTSLLTKELEVQTPSAVHHGQKLSEKISIVPILRGGLGMVEPVLELLPNASVHHLGMYHNKLTSLPIEYYNRLPKHHVADVAFVLDPLIATGSTMSAVVSILKKWGVQKIIIISVLASTPGLERLFSHHPDVTVHVAGVDPELTPEGLISPGLGDASDRLFFMHPEESTVMEHANGSNHSESKEQDVECQHHHDHHIHEQPPLKKIKN